MNPLIVEREEDLADIVRAMRTVAVVGIKDESRAEEPAHSIPALLAAQNRKQIGPLLFGHDFSL